MSTRKIPILSQLDTGSTGSLSVGGPKSTDSMTYKKSHVMYIAINEYSKRMEDELDMKAGDKIHVITDDEEYNDGWYYGRNLRTNEEGLYPVVLTQEISTEMKPSIMRAKSNKRVASLGNGSSSNLSLSQNGSTSELPTPQPIETGASVIISTRKPIDRKISLKSTMSDIDRALEELRTNSLEAHDSGAQNATQDTILSSTRDLDFSDTLDRVDTSGSTKSISNDTTAGISIINGIETNQLDSRMAENWTPQEVTAFFIMSGFDVQSASRFQQHKISGAILLQLELAHLKELEIDSFGTRFEIFKEIEILKSAIKSNHTSARGEPSNEDISSQLMPPAFLNQTPTYRGHLRKVSQSMDDLPSNPPSTTSVGPISKRNKHRPVSFVNGFQENAPAARLPAPPNKTENVADEKLFVSPRRAPKPPSYPSPVQPPRSPVVGKEYTSHSGQRYSPPTIYEKAISSSLEPPNLFKFPPSSNSQEYRTRGGYMGGNNSSTSSSTPTTTDTFPNPVPTSTQTTGNQAGNRSSVIYTGHGKTASGGSFVDLFNRVSMLSPGGPEPNEETTAQANVELNGRPSSSVYGGHSRTASVARIKHPSQSSEMKKHKRTSSMLSFFSAKNDERPPSPVKNSSGFSNSHNHSRRNSYIMSPFKQQFTENATNNTASEKPSKVSSTNNTPTPLSSSSPLKRKNKKKEESKRRSVSAKESTGILDGSKETVIEDDKKKRSVSEAVKGKSMRTMTVKNISKKQQTSAFMEGIRNISVREAMMDAECSGWMSKKGSGTMGVWRTRFFTLHGTRLSYFASTTDTRERGLIDITAHCVVPAKEDDKLVSLYAASTGKGRYCFKLLPPGPGSKKGLTFTQPRVHYFAVDTKDDMRAWMAALIKTTIDIDTSVPVISSCATPTVSLSRAQEMLSQARETTRLREQQRYLNEEDEDQMLWEKQQLPPNVVVDDSHGNTTLRNSDEEVLGSAINLSSNANTTVSSNGFSSPYLLASGVLSPNVGSNSSRFHEKTPRGGKTNDDYFGMDLEYSGEKL